MEWNAFKVSVVVMANGNTVLGKLICYTAGTPEQYGPLENFGPGKLIIVKDELNLAVVETLRYKIFNVDILVVGFALACDTGRCTLISYGMKHGVNKLRFHPEPNLSPLVFGRPARRQ